MHGNFSIASKNKDFAIGLFTYLIICLLTYFVHLFIMFLMLLKVFLNDRYELFVEINFILGRK